MVLYNVPIYPDQVSSTASRNHENDARRQSYNATAPKAERPAFRQAGEGVISAEGWDSWSRMTAAGLMESPKAKPEPPPFHQSGKGIISATPLETEEEKPEIEIVPIEQADLISGVVAAGVSLNSIRPLQPYPVTWDVFASPVALIELGMTAFRLPDPAPTINNYMSKDMETEYDAACLIEEVSPTRQRIPMAGQHNSYAIEARAIIRGQAEDVNAHTLLSGAATNSGVDLIAMEWSGPYAGDEARIGTISIAPHVIDGYMIRHTSADPDFPPQVSISAVDPDLVKAQSTAIFDLLFFAMDGATWKLIITRMR